MHREVTQFAVAVNNLTRQHDLLPSDWSLLWQTGSLHGTLTATRFWPTVLSVVLLVQWVSSLFDLAVC